MPALVTTPTRELANGDSARLMRQRTGAVAITDGHGNDLAMLLKERAGRSGTATRSGQSTILFFGQQAAQRMRGQHP